MEPDDQQLAYQLADEAGRLLVEFRSGSDAEGSVLARQGDRLAHDFIVGQLRLLRPEDAVVSEEDDPSSRPWPRPSRQWLVDPLDGTREFSERRADFAVHVALISDGLPVLGAVALPGEGLVLGTVSPELSLAPRGDGPLRVMVSRTRPPPVAQEMAKRLDAQLMAMGSAGAKSMAVVRGLGDVYLHAGGQYEWDSAAPVAVALAAGAHASRLDGSAIRYGRRDPYLPDLVVCRPELADKVLETVAAVSDGSTT
jgi:3'(2'), 5'-bisphosphate nucleotidase